MEKNTIHANEAAKAILKQKTLPYLPRNLGDVEAQRQILMMIAHVVPAVTSCVAQADKSIWPKVMTAELPISRAIAQCAYQTDKIIGSALLNGLMLHSLPETSLMQAWIALDYYAYILKADYSVNIRYLQDQITDVFLTVKTDGAQNRTPDNYSVPQCEIPDNNDNDLQPNLPDENTYITDLEPKAKKPVKERSGKVGRVLVLAAVFVLIIAFGAVFMLSDTHRAEASIRKIGTVTLESEAKIIRAEQLYQELTERQQNKIDNRDALFAARAEYDCLVTEEAIDQIGNVTMESKDALVHAEQLYEALSGESRNNVENYKTLTSARKEYDRLEAAIKKASDAINAIGEVTLQSGSKIEAARKAYDALEKDDLQKYLSKEVTTLTNAEKAYNQLVSQDLYDTGMDYYKESSYEKAIERFDTIIKDYSDTTLLASAQTAKADCQIALAEQSYGKRDYYLAMKMLDEMGTKYRQLESYQMIYDQIVSELDKARPKNAAVIAGSLNWGRCNFRITAADQDLCFKFQNTKDPSKYKMVYVRAGQKATVNVEDGTYSIKWAAGKYWYNKDHLFGDDTQYRSIGTVGFNTTYGNNRVYFSYVDLDMTSSSLSATPIDADDF